MQRSDLLLELGVEEIPAGYILPALGILHNALERSIRQAGLSYNEIKDFSTPRRFGLVITALESEQRDETIERIGPQVEIAYDNEGNLTKAALGFLKGARAEAKDIYRIASKKGEKIAVKLEKKGKKTKALLNGMINESVSVMNFPKMMRWGSGKMQFARPLRWVLCLFGENLVEIEINGLVSKRKSFGNRFIKLVNDIEIASAEDYEVKLKSVGVIANREERLRLIEKGIAKSISGTGYKLIPDERLLEEVTDLVESPHPVMGSFSKSYLFLPEKIIISTLSQNQKCFALRQSDGRLAPNFVFVNNGNPAYKELIRQGNEKVISARLADAEFYYREDTATGLQTYIKHLNEVLFQKDLGTLKEKTDRLQLLSEYIADKLDIKGQDRNDILRCSLLCKADLVTQMLGEKEFTKLQGYIGMKYAEVSGENELVARGIYEHYQPRGQNDDLPESLTGIVVALADKMDTVCGITGVGLVPTGSNDPFALRRAGNGIVSILSEKELEIDLEDLIEKSYLILEGKLKEHRNNLEIVKDFFKQRVNWLLKQKGIGYDVIESVMHIDHNNIPDLVRRAKEMESFRQRDDFIRLVLGFKRVSNIISGKEKFGQVKTKLLEPGSEQDLWQEFKSLKSKLSDKLSAHDYRGVLTDLVGFSHFIDKYFDDVLVNVEEEQLRFNRYNLLKQIREQFLQVADLAMVVVEEQNKKKQK